MYFVDREKIEETLTFLKEQMNLFLHQEEWNSPLEKAALERLTHMMIEAVLDVGNAVIDGFIMRDPGSYEDIIDILMDEKVVSDKTGSGLKTLIRYRKILVQTYTNIDHHSLKDDFSLHQKDLEAFVDGVRNYLTNELGPVSAFKN